MRKVLITGGTGFLGIHVAKKFLKHKWKVHLLDIAPLEHKGLNGKVTVHKGDVRDRALLKKLCKGMDVVVHGAAALPIQRDPKVIWDINVGGTWSVLQACEENDVPKVVYISSTAVYGIPKKHPIYETDPIIPLGNYGITKYEAEKAVEQYRDGGNFVCTLRPKTFLGPERLGVFQILFDWVRRGKKIYVIGKGTNKYQLLAVQDLADGIYLGATRPKANDTFNIGASKFRMIKQDLQAVLDYAKSGSRLVMLPAGPVKKTLRVLELARLSPLVQWQYETMDKDSFVSITKIKKKLGWKPKISTTGTLVETYAWYAKHWKEYEGKVGITHRVAWDQKILKLIRAFS
jgi:nucleoside-diphosphate-sugar epimerase